MPEQQETLYTLAVQNDAFASPIRAPLGTEEIISYVANRPPEYVPFKGILIHIQDATYPKKGFPTPESVAQINVIKALIKESLRHPAALLFTNKNKLLHSFNHVFDKAFSPYRIRHEYLCPTAYALYLFLTQFLANIGIAPQQAEAFAYNVSHILEYDDAYRYRIQDIMTNTTREALATNPRKELQRLFNLFDERTKDRVAKNWRPLITPLLLLLLIPKIKKAFIHASPSLKGMSYDDADRYWAYLKGDTTYHFGGMTYEERTKDMRIPQPYRVG